MLGTLFDKTTGLFDKRFTLALLLPAFAFSAGCGSLAATMVGWHATAAWWGHLEAARQVAVGVAVAAGIVLVGIVIGTQVVMMTRLFEGYWAWWWVGTTLGRMGRWREGKRRAKMARDASDLGYLRGSLAFPPDPASLLPTRLGNVLRAAESYPGDEERWGLDAAFWWPRLYLVMPDSARSQIDDARASLDQLMVLSMLSGAFGIAGLGLSCAGLNLAVGLGCAAGALLLSRGCYLAAVTSATVFGDLIRSCYDLYRGDLLIRLGWPVPATMEEERQLWKALGQQLYRRGASQAGETLLNAPRQRPVPPPQSSPPAP